MVAYLQSFATRELVQSRRKAFTGKFNKLVLRTAKEASQELEVNIQPCPSVRGSASKVDLRQHGEMVCHLLIVALQLCYLLLKL